MREKNKAVLAAGVLKSTIKLRSKLIFKNFFPLQMVQTKCQVICPHFSAQQTRSNHCSKPGGSGHLHQQAPAQIHSASTEGISASKAALPCFTRGTNTAPEQGWGAEQAGESRRGWRMFPMCRTDRKAWEKSPDSRGPWKPLATGQTAGSLQFSKSSRMLLHHSLLPQCW